MWYLQRHWHAGRSAGHHVLRYVAATTRLMTAPFFCGACFLSFRMYPRENPSPGIPAAEHIYRRWRRHKIWRESTPPSSLLLLASTVQSFWLPATVHHPRQVVPSTLCFFGIFLLVLECWYGHSTGARAFYFHTIPDTQPPLPQGYLVQRL